MMFRVLGMYIQDDMMDIGEVGRAYSSTALTQVCNISFCGAGKIGGILIWWFGKFGGQADVNCVKVLPLLCVQL